MFDFGALGSVACVAVLLVGLGAVILFSAIRIVPEYQRLVILRLGRYVGKERGPGLVFVIPIVDTPITVDLRETVQEIPHQQSITKDNAGISIDFLIYWKVVEPVQSVVQVRNFVQASQGIATTTLRAVIGDIPLDNVLAERERINIELRTKLDEVTERWGVKVTAVEIREIIPPKDVMDAMTRQMSAERTRRAVVTEAEGKRQATVTVATGDKDAAILRAEGEKQSNILKAEGERAAQALRAEGFAVALKTIFETAEHVDAKTMTLQYFETLKRLGDGPATKFIFPMEFTNLIKPIIGQAEESVR
jgi:regulator of protease activity HflC (stomatin/prohibitin superfamily)